MWLWIVIVVVLIALFIFIDREIYFYEGTHLSPRVQAWLYDRWAKKYDLSKKESQEKDAEFLAKPLLSMLDGVPAPMILDVATGTGRLPVALLQEADFNGHVVAVDISQGMLVNAALKLADGRDKVTLLQYEKFPLPFPDESFDVIACLEAFEVMPEMDTPLAEIQRLLRPGGILLTSRGTEASGRKAKVLSATAFTQRLNTAGFVDVKITPWWRVFDRVFARKPGHSTPSGVKPVNDILVCHQCKQVGFLSQQSALKCANCNKNISVDDKDIILYQ
jgi:ubiquinone/menaquinone biosynthesis C-methylase UbiE